MRVGPPDMLLVMPEWQTRACVRAQLIEDGFTVIATESWQTMRPHLRPGKKPDIVLVDLKGLLDPAGVLHDLHALMKAERVVVLTAMGTLLPTAVERLGFHVLSRPISIREVVRAAAHVIRSAGVRPPSDDAR